MKYTEVLYKKAAIDSRLLEALAKRYYPEQGSHGWDHIQDVRARAKQMIAASGQKWKPEMQAAALFHDSGLYPNGFDAGEVRQNHEGRGAEVAEKELKAYFSKKRLAKILAAIREHRGSYKGAYTSSLSDLISSADRGKPDLPAKLRRSVAYNLQKNPGMTPQEAYAQVAAFLPTKYGKGGYGRLPKYFMNLYGKDFKDFQNQVMNLTSEKVKAVIES